MPAMPKKTMSLDASRRIIFYFSVLLSLNNLVHFNPLASGGNRSWLWQCSRLPKEPRCSSCGPCCLVLEVEDGMMIHIGNTLSFFMGCTGLETSTSEQHTAYTTALFTPCPVALINSLARIDFMNQCTGERKIHFRVHSLITVWKDDRRDAVFRAKAASSRVLQHSVDGLAGWQVQGPSEKISRRVAADARRMSSRCLMTSSLWRLHIRKNPATFFWYIYYFPYVGNDNPNGFSHF